VAHPHRFDVGELFIDFRETLVIFTPAFRDFAAIFRKLRDKGGLSLNQ